MRKTMALVVLLVLAGCARHPWDPDGQCVTRVYQVATDTGDSLEVWERRCEQVAGRIP